MLSSTTTSRFSVDFIYQALDFSTTMMIRSPTAQKVKVKLNNSNFL